jgi:hypothetical protein
MTRPDPWPDPRFDPRLRISDDDRERAMADLAGHYADGRLDHEEYDGRLDAIWTARTRADLAVLFSDLPRPQPVRPPTPARGSARARRPRMPLLPVLAVLIVLSIALHAPVWLLVFPLLFLRRGRGASCPPPHGRADYRRPRGSHGW